jgi:hypothetical protein
LGGSGKSCIADLKTWNFTEFVAAPAGTLTSFNSFRMASSRSGVGG